MEQGRIIKGIGSFYTVALDAGGLVTCRLRGRLRLGTSRPLVGDYVRVRGERVDEILPRRNVFERPPVANIDVLVIVASAALPYTDLFFIDRLTAVAGQKHCEAIVCFNKTDLAPGASPIYLQAGYAVVNTSALTGEGIPILREALRGRTAAFAGQSGAGKSSLLCRLGVNAPVGEISEKLGRGRHTTRHVEFYPLGDSTWVVDTPGFSALETKLEAPVFPEFETYAERCRFTGCRHVGVADCAVEAAVREGLIPPSRYESYIKMKTIT